MAQNPRNQTNKKQATKAAGNKSGAGSQKSKNATGRSSARERAAEIREMRKNSVMAQITPYIIGIFALLLAFFIYLGGLSGEVGGAIGSFFKGVFASGALFIPPVLGVLAFRWKKDTEEGQTVLRVVFVTLFVILASALLHIWVKGQMVYSIPTLWKDGITLRGGGVIGGLLGTLLWQCFRIAAPIILVGILIIVTPLIFGITPKRVFEFIGDKINLAGDKYKEAKTERELLRQDRREREQIDREYGVVRYGKYADEEAAPAPSAKRTAPEHQYTIDEELQNRPKSRKRDAATYEADVPMPDWDKYEDVAPEVDPAIFDPSLREEDEEEEIFIPGISSKIDGYSEDDEIPDDTNFEETPPVGQAAEDDTIDLKKIFASEDDAALLDKLCAAYMPEEEDETLRVTREPAAPVEDEEDDEVAEPTPPPAPAYVFPPLSLLTLDTSGKDPGMREELQENAVKLVETLKSFNVKTKIAGVLRGPTITRYELMPESGTKVRTIANLTDDIALAFAAKGVRIEAPVPGKSVVGIEVPNKVSSTVYLRTLIDNEQFTGAQSKLHAALGEDVAGEAVYLDIAKMPHMLVAGATGMGKSVCINCLIVSLLYRAAPDEVKLILIDPKKVEFALYEGLPHLLVPVVSDPKKAAGSLSWAVSEMERRFNILENARVRDIGKYNAVARKNEGWEILPQIVIIIDELADLMMTASDDVEKSIARLAQKARAAGMHLIIGTQRPSVDVITGLIKNNIPSRISCAVTSQVDSRTILDRAGAEKLIGRGDMLYKPVGIDPIRVQGAFVSESEVESIVEFIKTRNNGKSEGYSEEVIEQIEREAEKCGNQGKKKPSADAADVGGEDDPMLMDALELAVESRKISTSLIQRKLSLGYGRAAKIIDRMEELGYVSAPDGQKPREVLISREEFLELSMKDE